METSSPRDAPGEGASPVASTPLPPQAAGTPALRGAKSRGTSHTAQRLCQRHPRERGISLAMTISLSGWTFLSVNGNSKLKAMLLLPMLVSATCKQSWAKPWEIEGRGESWLVPQSLPCSGFQQWGERSLSASLFPAPAEIKWSLPSPSTAHAKLEHARAKTD